MSLVNTKLRFKAMGGESFPVGNGTQNFPGGNIPLFDKTIDYADGSGLGKAQKWASYAISLAAGASVTVDLEDVSGLRADVDFTKIKALVIENQNTEQQVSTVTITGTPDGGTFTITVAGQTTSALAYNAAAATVQTAVRLLSTVGETLATVTGSAGGPYTIVFDTSLGAMTVTASGASLTGGTAPAATAADVPSNIELGDDSSGSNVWSAIFKGTNARVVIQPGMSLMFGTTSKVGFTVDGTHSDLLIKNAGGVAVTGVLLLLGEGA